MEWDLSLNQHTLAAIGLPKKAVCRRGGRSKSKNSLGDSCVSENDDRVCYVNTPNIGVYVSLTLALDLTTLSEVIFQAFSPPMWRHFACGAA